jgi:hypothetical protein
MLTLHKLSHYAAGSRTALGKQTLLQVGDDPLLQLLFDAFGLRESNRSLTLFIAWHLSGTAASMLSIS